jgi:hypothetical protein
MRLFRNKKGSEHGDSGGGSSAVESSSAGGAAVLLALITLFVIFYVLFLPPAERDKLLNTTNESGSISADDDNTFVFERPGTLTFVTDQTFEHDISAFTLYKTTRTDILEAANSLYVKSNVFEKQKKQVSFSVEDIKMTDNYVLSFNAQERSGRLVITLNGNVVFDNAIASINPEPIKLPKNLVKANNVLEFSVSGVGWQFWSSNAYSLDSINIFGDITDESKQSSTSDIYLESDEFSNIQKATLRFNPECKIKDVGQLDITVNSNEIFSGVPDCGVLNFKDVPKQFLENGDNKITFKTSKGTYTVDNVRVETGLKKATYPTYYFDLSDKEYNNLINGNRKLNASIKFVNNGDYKRAKLIVNGHIISIDAKDKLKVLRMIPKEYFDQTDNNYVRIEPDKNTIEISELKIYFYKP